MLFNFRPGTNLRKITFFPLKWIISALILSGEALVERVNLNFQQAQTKQWAVTVVDESRQKRLKQEPPYDKYDLMEDFLKRNIL